MKTRFSIFAKMLAWMGLALFATLLSACGGGGGGGGGGSNLNIKPPFEVTNDFVPQDELVILPPDSPTLAMLSPASIGAITANIMDEGELRFVGGAALMTLIADDAVLGIAPNSTLPYGLFRVVLNKRVDGADLVVNTRQAGLLDVIKDGAFVIRDSFLSSASSPSSTTAERSLNSALELLPLQTHGGNFFADCAGGANLTRRDGPFGACIGSRVNFEHTVAIISGNPNEGMIISWDGQAKVGFDGSGEFRKTGYFDTPLARGKKLRCVPVELFGQTWDCAFAIQFGLFIQVEGGITTLPGTRAGVIGSINGAIDANLKSRTGDNIRIISGPNPDFTVVTMFGDGRFAGEALAGPRVAAYATVRVGSPKIVSILDFNFALTANGGGNLYAYYLVGASASVKPQTSNCPRWELAGRHKLGFGGGIDWDFAGGFIASNRNFARTPIDSSFLNIEQEPCTIADWDISVASASSNVDVCVRDHACEDGDQIRVSIDGQVIHNGEIFNTPSCYKYPVIAGRTYNMEIYNINQDGGKCSGSNSVNTGEVTIRGLNLRRRQWDHPARTISRITFQASVPSSRLRTLQEPLIFSPATPSDAE